MPALTLRPPLRVVATILGATLLVSPIARADDAGPPPEAKKAFQDGKAAFERGEYERALQLFQRAALIAPAPSLYYNIGMAYERLGRYEDSAIAFEKYLQLIDPPSNDEERSFQANLRSRAAANRARARQPGGEAPPTPLVEPAPQPNVTRYPQYVYQPYVPLPPPPLSHRQKIDVARRHRNNGIAMLTVGGVLAVVGAGLTGWIVVAQPFDRTTSLGQTQYGLSLWGSTIPLIVGVTFIIPGAVALAKWQKELSAELKRPEDGAAAARSALDQYAPPLALRGAGDGAVLFGAPAVRF